MSLSKTDRKALDLIVQVMHAFKEIQEEGLTLGYEKYSGDFDELVFHIHALQNWVLANAAAQSYPSEFRRFGVMHKSERQSVT